MDIAEIERVTRLGESEALEFKKTTAELPAAGQTLCAFLNGGGGRVLIGVAPNSKLIGQEVSDQTDNDIARMLMRIEPPGGVSVDFRDPRRTERCGTWRCGKAPWSGSEREVAAGRSIST